MTTFSQIHDNASGYRRDFQELNRLVLQVAGEKGKGDALVSWFRLRDRRVLSSIDPALNELKYRSKTLKKRETESKNLIEELNLVKIALQNERFDRAQRILEEIKTAPDIDLDIEKRPHEALERIKLYIKEVDRKQEESAQYLIRCRAATRKINRIKNVFQSAKRTKDMDIAAYSQAIMDFNTIKKEFEIDVPEIKELPESYDTGTISELHEEIRAVVARIDGRYRMGLFAQARKRVRVIIHDVGNDRGKRAFTNRSREIVSDTNEAIDMFNKKYWQITGSRWERTGTNTHGYRAVAPTHPKIPMI
ncbi:hypothetical protein [Listeria booriae]|uniref:hypothetical protein n=1 Tax=Listeria booriae TaxID=1552123 RepID=UPI00162A7B05|nr:hypothetical protein [Listeria booriae]MBC2173997.1 hypothetical protein [Listeria booriae]